MSKGWSRNRGFPRSFFFFVVPIAIGVIAFLTAIIVGTVFLRPTGYDGQVLYPWFSFGSSFFFFFWIWPLFGFLMVFFFVARWFLWGRRSDYWTYHRDSQSILSERYATGEITKEQFDLMKRELERQ